MTHTRRLIVMRHAKAGELPGGPDIERALRPRGLRDAAAAGSWLAASGFRPDAVICSAARRTRQTWQYVAPPLGGQPAFSAVPGLYEADSGDVLAFVRQTPPDVGTLLYIGHNPAAAELVATLAVLSRLSPPRRSPSSTSLTPGPPSGPAAGSLPPSGCPGSSSGRRSLGLGRAAAAVVRQQRVLGVRSLDVIA